MELLNAMRASNCSERRIVKEMLQMLAPFAPHFAEECWERLGATTSIFDSAWPAWDEALTVEQIMEIPVQVNGKTRSRVQVPRGAGESMVLAAALRDPVVAKFVNGQKPAKVVYVQDRLINLVLTS